MLRVTGRGARTTFANEAGGHRWQRVPPTEKRGRVHSSTITVSVLPEQRGRIEVALDPKDLVIRTCRAGGKGGQHLQKNDTAVSVTHLPTGISVRCESRSQLQNKREALRILKERLRSRAERDRSSARDATRKAQVGRGERADKRRTIAVQRDEVVDHLTGKRTSVKRYLRGNLNDLTA